MTKSRSDWWKAFYGDVDESDLEGRSNFLIAMEKDQLLSHCGNLLFS